MNRTQKAESVEALKAELAGAPAIVATSITGISVNDVNEFRRRLRAQGASLEVVKNTLARLALADSDAKIFGDSLKGPMALAYHPTDPVAAAKVVLSFKKEKDKLGVHGGYFAGQLLDTAGVEALSKMPSRDELRSTFLGLLMAVPTKAVRTLAAAPTSFLTVLTARKASLEEAA
jgi:large subunit ribosomal protein L10